MRGCSSRALGLGLTALLLAGSASGAGLDPDKALTQYSLDVWTTEDDLPQNSVTAVLQSREGYLWLGTYGGLVRFDGARFETFEPAAAGEPLGGILALLEDRDGRLWVGTGGGGLLCLEGGRFETFRVKDGLPSDVVRALYEAPDGTLWVGTQEGLARRTADGFVRYGAAEGLGSLVIRAITEDTAGRLLVGTNGGGLQVLRDGRFAPLTGPAAPPGRAIFALLADPEGGIWVGTNGEGLSHLGPGGVRTYTARDGLSSDTIWSLARDSRGSLWIGTYGGGLCRLAGGHLTCLTSREGLSNDFVRALGEDREGSLWIGTYSGGLDRLRDGKFTTYTRREGLASDFARAVLEDRDGTLWVGTTGGGLCRLAEGRFRCRSARDGLSDDVRALLQDATGALWVGTVGDGLFRINPSGRVRYSRADGLPSDIVSSIAENGHGVLWVGTNGGGLARFDGRRFTSLRRKDGLASDFVMSVLVDRQGAVWAGTDGGGLSRVEKGRVRTLTHRDGLAGDIVFCLHQDARGDLWVGTSGGLSRIRDGRIRSFTTRDGLREDVVFSILEDDAGNLWLSGNKGVSRLRKADLEAVARGAARSVAVEGFGVADGMKSDECSGVAQPAGWRTRAGRLVFSTTRGIALIDPDHIVLNRLPPPVKIERLVVDGHAYAPRGHLEIPPGADRWEIHYTALSFLAPKRVRFVYKLEGYDRDWVAAGNRRVAYYTRIPPGEYTFRVVAANNDGFWNQAGASVSFRRRPRLQETIWFDLMLLAGAFVLAMGAYRARVRSLEARRRELEETVLARTRDLVREKERTEEALRETERSRAVAERRKEMAQAADRLKGELLSIAAHDLKTPLQSVIGFAELARAKGPAGSGVDEYARRIVAGAERMIGIIDRLLDSAALDAGGLVIERVPVNLVAVVAEAADTGRRLADQKGQRIELEVPSGPLWVAGDEERLLQVAENLVGNAVKYSPPGALLRVAASASDGRVRLEVADQGPGISASDRERLFGRFERLSARPTAGESSAGLGLYIVKLLVEHHDGRVSVEANPDGRGARFVVELPAGAPPPA